MKKFRVMVLRAKRHIKCRHCKKTNPIIIVQDGDRLIMRKAGSL